MINLPTKILLAIKPMRTQFKFTHRLICTPEYKYTPEYIYTRVFFAHAYWTIAFAWHIIVNLHVCICKNKICIWSDPGVNLPICKYTLVCICVRMRHLLTRSKICTPEYIYTCVFLAHANWTLDCHTVNAELSDLSRKGK